MRLALVLLVCVLWSAPAQAQNLYVNNTGSPACSDATVKASNDAANPWCTIGRAAWGSTNRAAPNTGEAVDEGETVLVTGGTYDSAVTIDANDNVLYRPVNSGTTGNYVTFTCVGVCVLTASALKGPIIGSSTADFVKWFADRSTGSYWSILACAKDPAGSGCAADTVATHRDTGPVVCAGVEACWVEGVTINGGDPIAYDDNYNGIQWEECADCTARNNVMLNYTQAPPLVTSRNQSCITIYESTDGLLEHNTCDTAGAFVYFKDTSTAAPQAGHVFRFNYGSNVLQFAAFSHVTGDPEGRSDVYQNIGVGLQAAIRVIGAQGDAIYNNTFFSMSAACLSTNNNANVSGVYFWNNICYTSASRMIVAQDGAAMPAAATLSSEHNVYNVFTAAQFYNGSDGNRTFASYLATYTDQDQASPASVNSDPRLANVASSNFRLCTGVNTPVSGCAGASPAIDLGRTIDGGATTNAGAYITGTECIGLQVNCVTLGTPTYGRLRGVR